MREMVITSVKDIRRRKNGSVAYFRGSVRVDGREIEDLRVQTTMQDEGAEDVRAASGVLSMPEAIALRVIQDVADNEARIAAAAASEAARVQRQHGHILDRLLPIAAVSEKQRNYAENKRRALVIEMSGHFNRDSWSEDAGKAALNAAFWDEVAAETNAKFWLDDVQSVRRACTVFAERARTAVASRASAI